MFSSSFKLVVLYQEFSSSRFFLYQIVFSSRCFFINFAFLQEVFSSARCFFRRFSFHQNVLCHFVMIFIINIVLPLFFFKPVFLSICFFNSSVFFCKIKFQQDFVCSDVTLFSLFPLLFLMPLPPLRCCLCYKLQLFSIIPIVLAVSLCSPCFPTPISGSSEGSKFEVYFILISITSLDFIFLSAYFLSYSIQVDAAKTRDLPTSWR